MVRAGARARARARTEARANAPSTSTSSTPPIAAPAVGARQILIFIVVSMALLMSSINATVVTVGIPAMIDGLDTSLVWIGWVITGYSLTQTIILPMAGKLSDDFGRKRLFLAAVVIFTLSSLLCTVAPNVYLLILFRIMQALGGGVFMPSAAGIVSDVFGPERRKTAIGLFTSVLPLGGIIGPNVGGWLIDSYGWRSMFFINVPSGVTLMVLGLLLLPSGAPSTSGRGIDLKGVASFAIGMIGIMYGMTVWGNRVQFEPQIALWFALGLLSFAFFLRHESRVESPMIDLRLLRQRAFVAANLYNLLWGALIFGFFSFLPLYATLEYGMSASEAGFILTPRAVAMILMSTLSSFVLIRLSYRLPMIIGILLISTSLILVAQSWHNPVIFGHTISNLVLLSVLISIGGFGIGISGPASNNAAIELMPEAVARITGLRGMFRNTGGVLGTSIIVLILAHYDDQVVGLEHVYTVVSLLVLLVIPPIFLIPDHARARRLNRRKAGDNSAS